MTEQESCGSEDETDQRRAVFDNHGANGRSARPVQIEPDVPSAFLGIAARLTKTLYERDAVADECDAEHDPRGRRISERLAVQQLPDGHTDGKAAADEERCDRGQERPKESLPPMTERMKFVGGSDGAAKG